MRLFVITVVLSLVGCSSAELSPEAQAVKLMKNDPPSNCKEVGSIDSEGMGYGGDDVKRARLRNRAVEKNGNYIRIDAMTAQENYKATVFKCP